MLRQDLRWFTNAEKVKPKPLNWGFFLPVVTVCSYHANYTTGKADAAHGSNIHQLGTRHP